MSVKVKNINGTTQNRCCCGSWLAHWEKFSGKTATYCGEKSCITKAGLVGAHVQRAEGTDSSWYIVPLCESHNKTKGELEVIVSLVPANKAETCEKGANLLRGLSSR